ncbi:MAG: hypothetical protein JNG83_09105 [Opitutaceae bacterium]|nr:hypothetical protein [Opitutaceae bacterium]
MNYCDTADYSAVAALGAHLDSPKSENRHSSATSLARLVARIHRRAAAPLGYRFVANIAAANLARAVRAARATNVAGEVQLVASAVDDNGRPIAAVAVYVRANLPEPKAFWTAFHVRARDRAA